MKTLTPSMLSLAGDEPRVFDLHLARALGFSDLHMVRRTIERNRDELEMHGEVSVAVTETSTKGGRPGKAYYLNEGQALVVCALSKTPKAAEVRKLIIDVFTAWRAGKLVPVESHYRALPRADRPNGSFFSLEYTDDGLARLVMTTTRTFALTVARAYLGA